MLEIHTLLALVCTLSSQETRSNSFSCILCVSSAVFFIVYGYCGDEKSHQHCCTYFNTHNRSGLFLSVYLGHYIPIIEFIYRVGNAFEESAIGFTTVGLADKVLSNNDFKNVYLFLFKLTAGWHMLTLAQTQPGSEESHSCASHLL